jgi:hypothetical protein
MLLAAEQIGPAVRGAAMHPRLERRQPGSNAADLLGLEK